MKYMRIWHERDSDANGLGFMEFSAPDGAVALSYTCEWLEGLTLEALESMSHMMLIPSKYIDDVPLQGFIKRAMARAAAAEVSESEKNDRAEYERLRAKYEGK